MSSDFVALIATHMWVMTEEKKPDAFFGAMKEHYKVPP